MYGWDGDRQCAEATDTSLRTTVHEPNSFVPLLRLEQQRQEEDPLLAEVRRLLASEGLQLPEEHRPAIEDLSVACFHTDHLGTPLRLTGEQGKTHWQGQADDWGAIDHEQGETDQPIGLLGGSNFYIYPVNPLQHKDSLGLSPAFTNVSGMTPSQVGQYAKAQTAINSISTKNGRNKKCYYLD